MNELGNVQFNVDYKATNITINNKEQLDNLVNQTISKYENIVFTDETIQDAKKAKADINKIVKLFDTKRKEVKKSYTEPLKEFEVEMNSYKKRLEQTSNVINEKVKEFEERELEKRTEIIKSTISEMCGAYNVTQDEIPLSNNWLNKTSFNKNQTEVTKKTLEDIAFVMKSVSNEKDKLEESKSIIVKYSDKNNVEPVPFVKMLDNGVELSSVIQLIDETVESRLENEKRKKAQEEYSQAMEQLQKEKIAEGVLIDKDTGEIIKEETIVKEEKMTVVLSITGTKEQMVMLNDYMVAQGIKVQKIK